MDRQNLENLKLARIKIIIGGFALFAVTLIVIVIFRPEEENPLQIAKNKLHVSETKLELANALSDTADKIARLSGTSNSLKSDFTKLIANLNVEVKDQNYNLKYIEWIQSCDLCLQEFKTRNLANEAFAKLTLQNLPGTVVPVDPADQQKVFASQKLMIPTKTKDEAIEALKTETSMVEIPERFPLTMYQTVEFAKQRGIKCGIVKINETEKVSKFYLVVLKGYEHFATEFLTDVQNEYLN